MYDPIEPLSHTNTSASVADSFNGRRTDDPEPRVPVGHLWISPDHSVLGVVEQNGAVVGKDEEVAVDIEVDEGVEIVLHIVFGVLEEWEREGGEVGGIGFGMELVVELLAATNDDGTAVGEDLIGCVPAVGREALRDLRLVIAKVRTAQSPSFQPPVWMRSRCLGRRCQRSTIWVGEDHEGPESVGGDIILGGVGGAVDLEDFLVGVVAALTMGEGKVRAAKVGPVKDDDAVVVEELHVHRRHADAALQEVPPPATSRGGIGRN